jgi:predicted AAA+ superfamily ATPase
MWELQFWRSTSGFEADVLLDDSVAIEVKGKAKIPSRDLKGLHALHDEQQFQHYIVVSCEPRRRTVGPIDIIPWPLFLDELWDRRWI